MYKIVKLLIKILFILLFYGFQLYAQQPKQDDYITVLGDSLVGIVVNGESIREVYGHVHLTQGNIKITCDKAIQFISNNNAELIGNVVAKQDTLTITTERGFYYGNEKRAESNTKVKLDDKKVILTADIGEYFFNENKAHFKQNVRLYDTTSTLTSNELIYYKNESRSVAVGNVRIVDSVNTIQADSLIYYRDTKISIANSNVKVSNTSNNIVIYGDHLEDYSKSKYTLIDKNPLLIQIDSSYTARDTAEALAAKDTSTLKVDTLVIRSLKMESIRDTANIFKAIDSVKMVRENFASINDITIYYKKEGKIITFKKNQGSKFPVMWYDNSQLSGDSIAVYLINNKINKVEVIGQAFVLSQHEKYLNRFDQVSGDTVIIHFLRNTIDETIVHGRVLSIYYMYDEGYPNGLTKSSSQDAVIKFRDKKISTVKLYGSPDSEYYPENQIEGMEQSFTLPRYVFYKNRPSKELLLKYLFFKSVETKPDTAAQKKLHSISK